MFGRKRVQAAERNAELVRMGAEQISNRLRDAEERTRVAALPAFGTTKKCPACGHESLDRRLQTAGNGCRWLVLPVAMQHMRVKCYECGWDAGQERPLFNKG